MNRIKKQLRIYQKEIAHEWKVIVRHFRKTPITGKEVFIVLGAIAFFAFGLVVFWLSSLKIPNLDSIDNIRIAQSTKIYDKTGKILLYDVHQDVKRTLVGTDEISDNIKKATVAIEDQNFYTNSGIEPISILRAVLANVTHLGIAQGGSTITQQLVKLSLLTTQQNIARKLKEWVLAVKLTKVMTKDQILTLYLNESPYGGQIYGVEEASQTYFGKHASEVDAAEGAYLASMLQAPTHYSPYGSNVGELDARHLLVLKKELDNKFITQADYDAAASEKVTFQPQSTAGIKAPHFVAFVIDELTKKYGEDAIQQGGMRVITTLDYTLEAKAEALVKQYALDNVKKYNASNAALVAIDPSTGGILAMVGSRDYFDKTIDGNFNVTTAFRQPGSTMKPIVYATAFNMGYQPETVVFDVPTEFTQACAADTSQKTSGGTNCYHPVDFDGLYLGPIDLRHALAQSRNIPAVQMLYLAGINNSLTTARNMGITSLNGGTNQYGLTLVLGGGEVSPLELTSAYSTFANNGTHVPYEAILRTEDHDGKLIDQFTQEPVQALPRQTALKINNVLSDYPAKDPNEFLHFPGHDVAAKTGTTNDYRDAWIMGYTPNIAVGVWTGNNDNSPMVKQVAGYIAAPLWSAFMHYAITQLPVETFDKPDPLDLSQTKPVLAGNWLGGTPYSVDKVTGQLATQFTPPEDVVTKYSGGVAHSILYWVNKADPTGPAPANPANDPQYKNWEYAVQTWLAAHPEAGAQASAPTQYDTVHDPANNPQIIITSPDASQTYGPNDRITVSVEHQEKFPLAKIDYSVNGTYIGSATNEPFSFSFIPSSVSNLAAVNTIKAVATDAVGNSTEVNLQLKIKTQ